MDTVPQAPIDTEWRLADTPSRRFEVSRDGRVRNRYTGREIALTIGQTGYWQFATRVKGRKSEAKLHKVHRLVIAAFVGPQPSSKHVVNHKDGDKLNNDAANLEWVTYAENTQHAMRLGLMLPPKGELNGYAKLTDETVRAIRREYVPAHPVRGCRALADHYGISHSVVSRVVNRKAWAHVGAES